MWIGFRLLSLDWKLFPRSYVVLSVINKVIRKTREITKQNKQVSLRMLLVHKPNVLIRSSSRRIVQEKSKGLIWRF